MSSLSNTELEVLSAMWIAINVTTVKGKESL